MLYVNCCINVTTFPFEIAVELSFCIETVGGSRVLYSRSLHFKNIIKKMLKGRNNFCQMLKLKYLIFLKS